jgi:hypothetical protein
MALHPDVILLDTGMPDGRFIVARLSRAVPDFKVGDHVQPDQLKEVV